MKKEYDFSKAKKGAVVSRDPSKVRITIRLDADIINHFKEQVHQSGGGNYQTLINEALREYLQKGNFSLNESVLRKVIREELQARSVSH